MLTTRCRLAGADKHTRCGARAACASPLLGLEVRSKILTTAKAIREPLIEAEQVEHLCETAQGRRTHTRKGRESAHEHWQKKQYEARGKSAHLLSIKSKLQAPLLIPELKDLAGLDLKNFCSS